MIRRCIGLEGGGISILSPGGEEGKVRLWSGTRPGEIRVAAVGASNAIGEGGMSSWV